MSETIKRDLSLAIKQDYTIMPENFSQMLEFSKMIASSDLAPTAFKNKPANVIVAIQMGAEIGMKPMQSIQNICVINGRPSIYGDAMIALIRKAPDHEYTNEWYDEATKTAFCEMKRAKQPPQKRKFSIEDAKLAGLWGKAGPWTQYPKRMLQLRARGFCARDYYADVISGISMTEEVSDYSNNKQNVYAPAATIDYKSEVIESVVPEIINEAHEVNQIENEIAETIKSEPVQITKQTTDSIVKLISEKNINYKYFTNYIKKHHSCETMHDLNEEQGQSVFKWLNELELFTK